MKDVCQKHISLLGCSLQAYLDGGHLCISSPAEALELQGVVAKAHSPPGRRGAFLQLEFQVVKVREIMVASWSGEQREHRHLLGCLARGHLRQADVTAPRTMRRPRRGGRGHRGRQSMPRCSLLGAGGTPSALPAATGSAPLLAGLPQRPADVAPAACGQEAPVYIPLALTSSWSLIKGTSQRAGSLGPLFLLHCIRFHIWPRPELDRLFLHLSAELFPGGRWNKVWKRSRPGAAALPPAVPALPGMAQSSHISSASSHGHSGVMPTLSQQEEGALLQGCDQWFKHSSFWYPKGYLTWLFAPQLVSKSGKARPQVSRPTVIPSPCSGV